ILDFTLSFIGSLLFLPFFLVIAIAIRLDSRGPAIFKHARIGKDGQPFQMYKFRTMYQNVKEADFSPRDIEDKRVTSVGRFLRKSSLDEVPQLWNVLKGEMSLVGPRPEMPFLVEKYTNWQKKRLDVKPGITGLWQILGRKDLPLTENIEYDFYYIKNRSTLLDLVILFKTAVAVVTGRGAY
ncbi:sugar transferase, partial [Candidatus Peregrinibacteria bacterium]|nr:sugar transferase [Candidatus Peregrinibacteria bacterium]